MTEKADAAEKTVEKVDGPSSMGFVPRINSNYHLPYIDFIHLRTDPFHSIMPLHHRHYCRSRQKFQHLRSLLSDDAISIVFSTAQNEAEAALPNH